jgi:hypothetical protein
MNTGIGRLGDRTSADGSVRWRMALQRNGVVALLYYGLAELSRHVASTPNAVTPVWPPDGLAIAYKIVTEVHGGSLEVESKLGQGSKFQIRL